MRSLFCALQPTLQCVQRPAFPSRPPGCRLASFVSASSTVLYYCIEIVLRRFLLLQPGSPSVLWPAYLISSLQTILWWILAHHIYPLSLRPVTWVWVWVWACVWVWVWAWVWVWVCLLSTSPKRMPSCFAFISNEEGCCPCAAVIFLFLLQTRPRAPLPGPSPGSR